MRDFAPGDDGMFPNMLDYLDRTRTAESTAFGKNPNFVANCIRRDSIVDNTRGIKLHERPHEEVNREGTSNDARKSFVESLHAEMNRESTTKNMDGIGHVNREGTSTNTIGHSNILEPHSQLVRDKTNPSIG
jgi:hypothetical protein